MKKNLTIIVAALLVAAMAIPASASKLTLGGEYNAGWTYDAGIWDPTNLKDASKLELKLNFEEGESVVAYLPLTIKPFGGTPEVTTGNWYFSYATAPFEFWVSNNNYWNPKKFRGLGDPLGIGAILGEGVVLNAKGSILGADIDIYAAGLNNGKEAYLGRATYGLPADFTLGLVGAYTVDTTNDLTFGADIAGAIPGIGAKLTLAGAGYWTQGDGTWEFEGPEENYAYQLKLSDIAVGPVTDAWAKYTAVGANFVSQYAYLDYGRILHDYADAAAAQVGVTVGIPVGIPVDLTLGDTVWMSYSAEPKWNETTAEIVAEPLADLKATVSGAYKADLNSDDDKDYTGYKVHGDVSYKVFDVKLNPYVDYKVDSYAKTAHDGKAVDTIVGLDVSGDPTDDLKVGLNSSYEFEQPITYVRGWGIYTTDLNPGFVKSAESKIAAVAEYEKEGDAEAAPNFYGYAGSNLKVNDAFDAKLGVLSKDRENGVVASATLSYKASESIDTGLTYTFREKGVEGWEHYKDGGRNYVKASVTGTVGDSTISVAYGVDGLKKADSTGFHAGKPWAYLRNHPGVGMNWELLTLSVQVPF
ncbi:MAG TPA: hypothetical protein PKH75_09120 [Bacillota bacterium]|nr:hypothetical protein [Bacillota bacterium]